MSSTPLFRSAAINANKVQWLGEIVQIRPLSFRVLTGITVAMALLVASFVAFGSYTKRSTVIGQLIPDAGQLRIYASQPGIVLEKHVREGQWIKKGEVLFVTSSERQSSTQHDIQANISRQVALRKQSLSDELRHTRQLQQDEASVLRKKIAGFQAEQANLINQIAGQRSRNDLAEAAVRRAAQLLAQGFISTEIYQQKQADFLEQRNRLKALERDQLNVQRELQSQQSELDSLPLRQQTQLAQIERLIASTDQEWTESEGKRLTAIIAHESGIASAVTAEIGQAVDGDKPLVSIIPDGSVLQAHLFAPSRAVGFIRPGDHVLLRYQAYPYQKFGHAHGVVATLSQVALSARELADTPVSAISSNEPFYRITVSLASQTITAYGKPLPLQAGMLVDADILHERRKLYEWVFEPLYSLTGKL
ncbi:HlyD family efflux transporter periplasmic adaptor subunit [Massilia horti]|uniref:HlyD family efflux transporter periplasmic adaptor subunit n=1 Tax=Massilia horti TaxID=2562153 RepID=A0A4Y9SR92_9BURK|nr:HlyD family efflux transporter periplasmic adaptor subunit [Massilia horti]